MLAKITEQLEEGLTYDHIGMGIVDYTTREIVVIRPRPARAAATLGRRMALGTGLVGHVARNGQMAFYRAQNVADAAFKPLMPDTTGADRSADFCGRTTARRVVHRIDAAMTEFSDEEVLIIADPGRLDRRRADTMPLRSRKPRSRPSPTA